MTRQGAKEMMLQGKKVTHSTFESDEYAYMDCIVKLNSGKPFLWFYSDVRYKTGWTEYQEEKQNNMKYSIKDLREGRVVLEYTTRNKELLIKVLSKAFPKHKIPNGLCRYYMKGDNDTWIATMHTPEKPIQQLEHFELSLSDDRFPFQLDIKDVRRILNIACAKWQKKLLEKWSTALITGFVQVDEEFYEEMRSVCTTEQHELFNKIFGEDYGIEWKPNHVYLLNVGDYQKIRVSSEERGRFYSEGNLRGGTVEYKAKEIIKIIGPI